MTEQELKHLFRKRVPAAYLSLKEVTLMPEGEAKRYKVNAAYKIIDQAQEILTSCYNDLKFKDELILVHRVENVPKEHTARILYDSAEISGIRKVSALETHAIRRLSNILIAQQAKSEVSATDRAQSMEERVKAREQRMMG